MARRRRDSDVLWGVSCSRWPCRRNVSVCTILDVGSVARGEANPRWRRRAGVNEAVGVCIRRQQVTHGSVTAVCRASAAHAVRHDSAKWRMKHAELWLQWCDHSDGVSVARSARWRRKRPRCELRGRQSESCRRLPLGA